MATFFFMTLLLFSRMLGAAWEPWEPGREGGKYVVSKSVNRGHQKIAGARSWGLDHLDVEVLEVFAVLWLPDESGVSHMVMESEF